MRIPYTPNPPPTANEEESAILERVLARRAPRGLIPLDLALLHSFPVADGWNTFLGAIRTRTSIADDIRELAICRVAVVNHAWFEWEHHAPLLKNAGLSDEALRLVENVKGDGPTDIELASQLNRAQVAVFKYTDAMTKNVKVPDPVFAELKDCFEEQEVVEITATVAAYNCVSRFLVALDVGEKNTP
jgi:alkylhydroperoxidase family enzyme